jgi:hypothetical protein
MKALLELTARLVDLEADDGAPCCPRCEQMLNLHQPDENLPNQLLATCGSCLRWYSLFGISIESGQFLMIDLPDTAIIEAAGLTRDLQKPQ